MADVQQTTEPIDVLSHFREVNRKFDDTPDKAAYRLEACMTAQLGELGLIGRFDVTDEQGEFVRSIDYVEPKAVRVIINAFLSGKFPQPEGPGSFLLSQRTALGRQSALDTALEFTKASPPYDVTADPDFYPETGEISG